MSLLQKFPDKNETVDAMLRYGNGRFVTVEPPCTRNAFLDVVERCRGGSSPEDLVPTTREYVLRNVDSLNPF